jgi:carboxyl-terminal processing protease
MQSRHQPSIAGSYLIAMGLISIALSSCGGGSGSQNNATKPPNSEPLCAEGRGKDRVLEIFEQDYLWNDEMRQQEKYAEIQTGEYPNDEAVVAALRWQPEQYDRGFSYITSPEAEDRQNAGQALSYGFSLLQTADSQRLIVQETIEGGPVHTAGVRRGWELVAIDDVRVSTFSDPGSLSAALGYPDIREGTTRALSFRDLQGNARGPFSVAVADFAVNPLPEAEILSIGGEAIGYMRLRSFVPPAVEAFAAAIAGFNRSAVRKIVIDLRYNGGGSLAVAEALAGMVAGSRLRGKTMYYIRFNEQNRGKNGTGEFRARYRDESLLEGSFTDIVFLTTRRTASASELLLHSLKPYPEDIRVAVVGTPTYGKPVGQIAQDYCDGERRLRTVAFSIDNADGDGNYFAGIPVDCRARDGWETPLGNPDEASLATALALLTTGSCPTETLTLPASARPLPQNYLGEHKRLDGIL